MSCSNPKCYDGKVPVNQGEALAPCPECSASVSTEGLGDAMARQEWVRRFAARIMDVHKWDESDAMMVAEEVADRDPEGDWLDPEEEADVEMSYWTDDDDA